MTHRPQKKLGKIFFYLAMTVSVVAMVGFGITGIFSQSTSATVATVGDEEVTAQEYFRTLQRELRNASDQLGQSVTITQAVQFGIDRSVLSRLVSEAALRGETKRLGISVSDETVRDELLNTPAFLGLGGVFDKDIYKDVLNRSGLDTAEYETLIRDDAARAIVQNGITAGAILPDDALTAVFDYMGEKRAFTYAKLTAENLPGTVPEPTDSEIKAYYEAHPETFTQPLTRHITYISLTPEQVAATAEVSDADIQAAYEANADQYNSPAKRFVERIVFASQADAEAARARLDSGDATYYALTVERGLNPEDVDLGDVTAGDVGKAVADVLFSTTEPGVYGPLDSDLGPALYRINAVVDASSVPLVEVKDDLRHEIALSEAGGTIAGVADEAIDLIAGGATLEEVADETAMELGNIDLAEGSSDGIAAYAEFRDEATAAEVGEERDIVELSDGGIVALRVDKISEPFVKPLDSIREDVIAKWKEDKTQELILVRANQITEAIAASNGGSLDDFSGSLQTGGAEEVTRTSNVAHIPPAVVPAVFDMKVDNIQVFEDFDGAVIVQLNTVTPFDPQDFQAAAAVERIKGQANDLLAQDVLTYFDAALVQQAAPTVNQARIDALHTQLN